jgi:MarR family multiple antibiotic resistance transcriptional regulator
METSTREEERGAQALAAARSLSIGTALLARVMGRTVARWGLTWPQAASLILLGAQPAPVNASWLVSELGLGRTAMTAAVDRLERRGWVVRRPHPHDRRIALLELTPDGRRVGAEARAAVQAVMQRLLAEAALPAEFGELTERLVARRGAMS